MREEKKELNDTNAYRISAKMTASREILSTLIERYLSVFCTDLFGCLDFPRVTHGYGLDTDIAYSNDGRYRSILSFMDN